MRERSLIPVLLTSASYYGTLAAARCLGRAGVPLTVADPSRIAPTSWSRYVQRRVRCPADFDADGFHAWLMAFGRAHPRHLVYPTSDEMAFLLSRSRDELGRHFLLYQPSLEAIFALLNKRRLWEHGRAVGLQLPDTAFPETEAEVASLGERFDFPVLLKPVTQILYERHLKGRLVETKAELPGAFAEFAREKYAKVLTDYDPTVSRPMVQALHPEAQNGIYNLSGFIDETGERFVVSGSLKVLQRPRKLGVGVCFESAPVREDLAEGLKALCKRVGYFGVFEAEFIPTPKGFLLIDFNPRFYGQMGFDIARGAALPLLAYHAARGDTAELDRHLAAAQEAAKRPARYCHRVALEVMLRAQSMSGALSRDEARQWWDWSAESTVDAVLDGDDWVPAAFELAHQFYGYARHPRAFLRSMVLNK